MDLGDVEGPDEDDDDKREGNVKGKQTCKKRPAAKWPAATSLA